MKKLILFAAALCCSLTALADEGMWLLPYLQKMNIAEMKKKGCKLTAEQIYSADKSSLKDAIVIFGNGCTGEIVSGEGLLLTNHHCGYGSIQALSSVENDFLKNGFWAMNNKEEIPAPGLKVRFVRKIADATADILGNVPSIAGGEERKKIIEENVKELTKRLEEQNPGMEVNIESFFGGNQYFSFVMEVFSDVRLVGTPPSSIGKFGGETDNWMWPRHTGDFSVFRVYAGADNKPADYSPENRPYKAETFLKVSTQGYKPGDFAMIMGFPGSTERYMTSYEIDRMLAVENPQRIAIRGERQDILKEAMAASDKVRIQYASKYAGSSNYWKNSIGMSKGLKKLNVKAKKQEQERAFQKWAEANTLPEEGFIDALPTIEKAMNDSREAYASWQYLNEALLRSVELINITQMTRVVTQDEKLVAAQQAYAEQFFKDYDPATDRKVARRMLELVEQNCKAQPAVFEEANAKFGSGEDADFVVVGRALREYVDYVYDNTIFTDKQKVLDFLSADSETKKQIIANDPAMQMANSIVETYREQQKQLKEATAALEDAQRLYIAGLMRMQPKKAWASDANFTIRLTYGSVLPYDPVDGVSYNYYTTLKGVIDKEDVNNPVEFTVPEKIKELYAAQDYGRYANSKGELPVAFLADCDITGGNSGSPIMNARGELIGLAFDGNWEAMSGDVAFEPELQRTISVDSRYVLFIIDKFAGAGWLLDEMEIR